MITGHGRGWLACAVGVVVLSCSTAARAEVRHQVDPDGTPWLEIQPTNLGPWSLLGQEDPPVLNAGGDSAGDGLPGAKVVGDSIFAAWTRPMQGLVLSADWDGSAWQYNDPILAPNSGGTPATDAIGTGWAVTWQMVDGAGSALIVAAGVGESGASGVAFPIAVGHLLASTFDGTTQYVVHEINGPTDVWLTAILWAVPGVPSPVEVMWSVRVNSSATPAPGDRDREDRRTEQPQPPGLGPVGAGTAREFDEGGWKQLLSGTPAEPPPSRATGVGRVPARR